MGLRLGLIAAVGALALALARVARLVDSGPEQAPAVVVLAIATLIGAIVTQAMHTLRLGLATRLAVGAAGALLLIARLTAPETMIGGLVPTGATPSVVAAQMTVALELIRFGSAPVAASPGLVAVLAAVFWTLGSVAIGALAVRRYLLATVPVLGFYLLAATFDRQPPAWWHPLGLIVFGSLAFLAAARASGGGRVRLHGSPRPLPAHHRAVPSLFIAAVALAGTVSTFQFASAVPESGMVAWRNPTGFGGSLFGGFSYNLFASMQQDLASNSDVVGFLARVSESAPANSELYWKLISLDSFDGVTWQPGNLGIRRPASPDQWEAPDFQWQGSQVRVESVILIQSLRQNYLPVLYSPRGVESDNSILMSSFRTREDGSLKFDALTREGLIYRVTSDIGIPDLAVLATEGGELSPLFANAQAEGDFTLPATQVPRPKPSTRLTTLYTALPEDLPPSIAGLARQVTARTSTDFERALVLEEFFRNAGGFVYDASASTGHSSLQMEDWLLVPSSRNYRRGYCEQFAASMAVMARALDMPARVVMGFAPGTIQTQSDGTEVIVVRARDGHAWVEVYLDGQGWVRFDPTPRSDGSNPATSAQVGFTPTEYLPAPADPGDVASQLPGSIDTIDSRFLDPNFEGAVGDLENPAAPGFGLWWLLPLGPIVLTPVVKSARRGLRMARLGRGEVGAGWAEFSDRLADLGWRPSPAQTPIELARLVDEGGGGTRPLAERLTANLFGNRTVNDGKSAFQMAEKALRSRYSAWRWWMTWLQPRTLWTRLNPNVTGPKVNLRQVSWPRLRFR